MEYCCDKMEYFAAVNKKEKSFDPDDIILYIPKFDEYGLIIHDSGKSYIKIDYCPWCGTRLPDSKRDLWFNELERMGIDDPVENEIPVKFKSSSWWKDK